VRGFASLKLSSCIVSFEGKGRIYIKEECRPSETPRRCVCGFIPLRRSIDIYWGFARIRCLMGVVIDCGFLLERKLMLVLERKGVKCQR